jgi:hypothetical protein
LRGLVVAFLAQQLIGSTLASEISYRLAAAVLFQPGFLILIALLANDRDDHRNLVGALRERERQATELEATATERLARMPPTTRRPGAPDHRPPGGPPAAGSQ